MSSTAQKTCFVAIGGSVRGAAHRANGKPNQDGISLPRTRTGIMAAVASSDGHGSPQYFRSDYGSHAAAVSGRTVLSAAISSSKKSQLATAAVRELVTTRVPRSIYSDWRKRIDGHLRDAPISEFELGRLDVAEQAEVRGKPAIAYGCTLLAAALGPHFGALARIGDGTVAVIDQREELHRPFREDHRGGDESTQSLCSPSAPSLIEAIHLDYASGAPRCVICATDGYTKSFAGVSQIEDALYALYEHVARHGVEDFANGLRELLDSTTNTGSGDDTTVVMIVNQDAF